MKKFRKGNVLQGKFQISLKSTNKPNIVLSKRL